jgi:hypothetical protein
MLTYAPIFGEDFWFYAVCGPVRDRKFAACRAKP